MDDDPVRKGLVVRLDVKCPLLAVQCVLLDEVDVVHTCNLYKNTELLSHKSYYNRHTRITTSCQLSKLNTHTREIYPFKQTWSINIQGTTALNLMGGAILVGLLVHHVTRHKHGDEVAGGEPALIGLKGRKGDQKCQSDFKNTYVYIFCCVICICVPQTMVKYDHKIVFLCVHG